MLLGYARVSTENQNLYRQTDALKKYGVEERNIYMEKITGTRRDRPELNRLLDYVQAGDVIVISELTRLGRSTRDLISISELLNKKKVELISLKEKIDTTTATGKAMFGMLAVMAQFERDLIAERTREGLSSARARGQKGGRRKLSDEKIDMALTLWDSNKYSSAEVSEKVGISKRTLFNYIKKRNFSSQYKDLVTNVEK